MLEVIGNVGSAGSGVIRAAVDSASAYPSTQSGAESLIVTPTPLSPRIKSDPAAGVMIAEYLTSSGEKSMQFPSSAVVAYLRSGLTADGLPKKNAVSEVQAEV